MKRIVIILMFIVPVLAFSQNSDKHEYLSITQRANFLYITLNSENYESINVKNEIVNPDHDHRPLFKRVNDYEQDGWSVISFNNSSAGQYGTPSITVIMRRKKD